MTKLKDTLACCVLAALAWLGIELAVATHAIPGEVRSTRAALVGEVRDARASLSMQISRVLDGDPNAASEMDRVPLRTLAVVEIDRQATGFEDRAFARIDRLHRTLFELGAAGLTEIDRARQDANLQLAALNNNVATVGQSATELMDTYEALPRQLRGSPEWRALQPEITCRQADGSGYGGCWHSRITALMGEAARDGGVFTQHFPALADAVTGIGQDAHGLTSIGERWAAKNIDPHPMTKKEKAEALAKYMFLIALAGLRSGAF